MPMLFEPSADWRFPPAGVLSLALLLSGCAAGPGALPASPAPIRSEASGPVTPAAASPAAAASAQSELLRAALVYADAARTLPAPELVAEVTRLAPMNEPLAQLQLALALAQWRQLPELVRAQDSVAKVLDNPSPPAQALHPLARLLAARFADQRRIEEQLERQNQQVRDIQRRLEQTTERLEALKAIERSLGSRPAGRNASQP